MSSYGLAKARYASDATQTVSPARLVTMLYDRLIVDLAGAEDALRRNDFAAVGTRIGRAQEILLELHATLDLAVWPDGEPLSRLYLWMVSELMQARLKSAPELVEQCRMLLEPLRDAWYEVTTGHPSGGPAGTAPAPTAPVSTTPVSTAPETRPQITPGTDPGTRRYVITSVGAA